MAGMPAYSSSPIWWLWQSMRPGHDPRAADRARLGIVRRGGSRLEDGLDPIAAPQDPAVVEPHPGRDVEEMRRASISQSLGRSSAGA